MARPPSANSILRKMKQKKGSTSLIPSNFQIPNTSGDHMRGTKRNAPINNQDLVNKEYIDNSVLPANIHITSDGSDHSKVTANETAIALNTTHRGSNGTNHANVVLNDTHRGSNGSDHSKVTANETAIALNTTHRGGDGADHADVAANTAASHAQAHTLASHSSKDHSELTNVGANDHHNEVHTHTHASATGQTANDHHAQSHNIASHSDTSATGAELNTLTDNSIANTLHRHSELVASDGSPDPCVSSDASGNITLTNQLAISGASRIRAYRSGVQAINDSVWTKVQLNAEYYDNLGEFDHVTNHRFQPLINGYYLITGCAAISGMTVGPTFAVGIYKNGAEIRMTRNNPGAIGDFEIEATDIIYLTTTDYVELYAYQSTGITKNLQHLRNKLAIHRLS